MKQLPDVAVFTAGAICGLGIAEDWPALGVLAAFAVAVVAPQWRCQ